VDAVTESVCTDYIVMYIAAEVCSVLMLDMTLLYILIIFAIYLHNSCK